MTVFSIIRLALLVVMVAAFLWPMRTLRQSGCLRKARGHGLMATGIVLAQISEIQPLFGLPREHWSYWPLFFVGMGLFLFGTKLVLGTGRGRSRNPERNPATR